MASNTRPGSHKGESKISTAEKRRLKALLRQHKPYPDDAPELNTFDGDVDIDRLMATLAQDMFKGRLK